MSLALAMAIADIGGGGAAGGFSPISRSPTLWIVASTGVTTSGGNVTAWADQSGNGNNLTQASTGPTFNATDAKLNGKPSVQLLGTSRSLQTVAGFNVAQPDTIYCVGYFSTTGEIFDGGVNRQTIGSASGQWQYFAGGSVVRGGTSDTNAHVFCGIFNGNTLSALYVDNSTTAIITGGNPGTLALTQLVIPGVAGATGGAISEQVIIPGSDSQPQRLQMFQYLGSEYGITVS